MTVDAETLRPWLEAGTPLSILDERPRNERMEWSIPGSIHVDAYDALRAHDPRALPGMLDRTLVEAGTRLRRIRDAWAARSGRR